MITAEALLLAGVAAAEAGDHIAAVQHWHGLIAQAPPAELLTQAWFNLGLLLLRCEQPREAEHCLQAALAADPDNHAARSQLALLQAELLLDEAVHCSDAGQWCEAESLLRRAIDLAPAVALLHRNLGVVLYEQRRYAEAEAVLRHVLTLAPADSAAEHTLAQLLLASGRMDEGWRRYESRFAPDFSNAQSITPQLPFPRWQGESLVGKSLLIWPEQGLGDEIQFCRYIAQLKSQGAAQISLVSRPALLPLFASLAGVDTLISSTEAIHGVPRYDYWTFSLSIPLYVGSTAMPAKLPYLQACTQRRARWAEMLPPRQSLRVGLLWQGNPRHQNDAFRSIHTPAVLADLLRVEGVSWVSLQRDPVTTIPAGLYPAGAEIADFADAAALIAELDLLISVDSAYAHLAGAIGAPVWLMLPSRRVDWRWQHERSDSPWYPEVMRIFRQSPTDDWSGLLMQISRALNTQLAAGQGCGA